MKKSKFNLSYLNSTTGDAGRLIPFLLQPTLPNDSFRISLSSFIRAQPMLAPLMHEVKFYTQYWYVPYRIIWDDWESFITGGDGLDQTPAFPVLPANTTFTPGSLGDYFGFPINVDCAGISVLPFRAYNEIWNTRYRDEDLQTEKSISYGSGTDNITSLQLLSPSWKRDYFTVARPWTQRGSQISVPIGSASGGSVTKYGAWVFNSGQYTSTSLSPTIPLEVNDSHTQSPEGLRWVFSRIVFISGTMSYTESNKNLIFRGTVEVRYAAPDEAAGSPSYGAEHRWYNVTITFNMTSANPVKATLQDTPYRNNIPSLTHITSGRNIIAFRMNPSSNLVTAPFSQTIQATGSLDIRDLRLASSLQRYAERAAMWGNRYEEFIQREFGIKPRDSRIQRPEYLGGGSGTLQISEVLQTAEGSNTGVGTMRGHGVAGLSQRPIKFRSPEHGLIIGLLSIRPKPVYTQGVNREFLKKSRLDFFTPELANIGMQEVLQRELFVSADNANTVFGYSDRYQEYRYNMPKVTGEFRTTLNFWNMARTFSSPPVINSSFIDMHSSDPAFKRPFAIQNKHSYLMMLRNNIKAYRPIPKKAKNILK